MNDILNNIFDEESLSAIKNANKISPSPETMMKQKEVEYKEIKTETIDYSQQAKDRISFLEKENRELSIKVQAQKELIHKIIESQNQMIKEITIMQEKIIKIENLQLDGNKIQEPPKVESAENIETKKQEQQTSSGENLNPDDFSVEDIFYMGNK